MQGEKQLRAKLSPTQLKLYSLLRSQRDVKIETLFSHVYGKSKGVRQMQQLLGPHIYRLNAKACEFGWIVRPGNGRRTYRSGRSNSSSSCDSPAERTSS